MTFARSTTPIRRAAIALLGIATFTTLAAHEAGAQATKSAAKKAQAKRVQAAPVAPIRFTIGATGNEARYRVREQLMGKDLPNDAVGATSAITGTILAYPDGRIVKDSSKIVIDVRTLKSDQSRRDGFLQRRTLETEKYPTVELVPTEIRGFDGKIPASGDVTFQLLGDLTVHGVTRPTVWNVKAHQEGQDFVGNATTAFTFKDINLDQPKVPVVLSVADTIKLEYDFKVTKQ
jgi:polyisoprenoid-binding protein YceI